MTTFALADDLLVAAREISGTDEYVGVEMTGPIVTCASGKPWFM